MKLPMDHYFSRLSLKEDIPQAKVAVYLGMELAVLKHRRQK
jgi:hypothetical protein